VPIRRGALVHGPEILPFGNFQTVGA
jgi:hypothetical protein